MSERPDRFERAAHLKARVQQLGVQFVLTELQAGLALLDVAATSEMPEANERRRALALEAYEVVTSRLAQSGDAAIELTGDTREKIRDRYEELGKRLGRSDFAAGA